MKIDRPRLYALLLIACAGVALITFELSQQYQEVENYTQIEDGLWLGGLVEKPPPGTQAVLNLCQHRDPYPADPHRWEAIRDGAPAPSLDWLERMVEFVEQQHGAGKPTYVHCFAGVSRSGMVVTAYLMKKYGWPRDQALAFVRSKRAIVNPNPAFMQRLTDWELELKGRK